MTVSFRLLADMVVRFHLESIVFNLFLIFQLTVLLSCSAFDDDDEEELLLLPDELLEEFDEFDDVLESLSFPSFTATFSCIGSFLRVIFNFGIWPFETFEDCTWKTSIIRCGGVGGFSVRIGNSGCSTLTIEANESPKSR